MKYQRSIFVHIILLFLLSQSSNIASSEEWPLSLHQLSMAYIVLPHDPDPLLLYSNPSCLHAVKTWSMVSSQCRPYGMKELSITGMGIAARWKNLVLGTAISQFGCELYQEQKITFGISVDFLHNIHVGLALGLQQIKIKKYGQTRVASFDLGWVYTINPKASITGSIQNIHRATIGNAKQSLPQIIRMGFKYSPMNQINLLSEVYKNLSFEPESRFGLEIKANKTLYLRFGTTINPCRFTSGFGFFILGFEINYGLNYHQVLGYTHAFGFMIAR